MPMKYTPYAQPSMKRLGSFTQTVPADSEALASTIFKMAMNMSPLELIFNKIGDHMEANFAQGKEIVYTIDSLKEDAVKGIWTAVLTVYFVEA